MVSSVRMEEHGGEVANANKVEWMIVPSIVLRCVITAEEGRVIDDGRDAGVAVQVSHDALVEMRDTVLSHGAVLAVFDTRGSVD